MAQNRLLSVLLVCIWLLPTIAVGQGSGSALDFDGGNESIDVSSPLAPTLNSNYTIEVWIFADVMGTRGIIGWGNYGADNQVNALRLTGVGFSHYWWANDLDVNVGDISGAWHHVAATFDGTTRALYLDGVLRGSDTPGGGHNVPNSNNFAIGVTNFGEFFDGLIDEVRVWNLARTQAQIQDNMSRRLSGAETGLVGYWRLDEGSGTTAVDSSPSGDNGTLLNMEAGDWVTSGAAIGDVSANDYASPVSVSLAHPDGDQLTVDSLTGAPDGVQVYRVDAAPNVATPPGLSSERYWGVFIAGGGSPSYTATYNYAGHPGISDESVLLLATRDNNADTTWANTGAVLDTGANTLTSPGHSAPQAEFILGVASTGLNSPDIFQDGFEDPTGSIEFVGDQSVVFGQVGDSANFTVIVRDLGGQEIPGAQVSWSLSDSGNLAIVAQQSLAATVSAQAFSVQTVMLNVFHADTGARASASILLADLAPIAVYVPSSDVVSGQTPLSGQSTIVLVRNAQTEAIQVGDILISGSDVGLLVRVVSVTLSATEVILQVEPAALTDAFENLSLSVTGPAQRMNITISEQGGVLRVFDAANKRIMTKGLFESFECTAEDGSAVGLSLDQASLSFDVDSQIQLVTEIDFFTMTEFVILASASATLTATTGAVRFSSTLSGKISCTVDVGSIATPAFPVSVFSFQLALSETLGFDLMATLDGPSFNFVGPSGSVSGTSSGGIRYTPGTGWNTVAGGSSISTSFTPISADFDPNVSFDLMVEPFVQAQLQLIVNLGRPPLFGTELANVGFLELRRAKKFELGFASPFDPADEDYTGPVGSLTDGVTLTPQAVLNGGVLATLLERLGIPTAINLGDPIDPIINESTTDWTTRMPVITGPASLNFEDAETGAYQINTNNSDDTGSFTVYSIRTSGDNLPNSTSVLLSGSINAGLGMDDWTPGSEDEGIHRLFPRVSVDVLSTAFPYAGDVKEVDVKAGDSSIAAAISSGSSHTCALTTSGGVKCWGSGSSGQQGDGTFSGSATPVDVVGLTSGVVAISLGYNHTCALTTAGGVKCWGNDGSGQLGDGLIGPNRPTPADVIGLTSGVAAISAGGIHTCALTISGGVKCWGHDGNGQLGDGTKDPARPTPANVVGLTSGVAAISAGGSFTCALTTSGGVKCWGSNGDGQLGDDELSRPTPADVIGLTSGVAAISASHRHVCALKSSGGVKCWGENRFGQLGDGTIGPDRSTPTDVIGLTSGVAEISAGAPSDHTCALTTLGGIKCWGNDGSGQLGDGTIGPDRPTPADVIGLTSGVAAISAGGAFTCALTTAGGVKCWGNNGGGTFGPARATPGDIIGFP